MMLFYLILTLICVNSAFIFGGFGFGLNLQRTRGSLNMASRCGAYEELYWKLRQKFDELRDKTKRKPRELDYGCFTKWEGLQEMPPDVVEQIWLKCVDDFQTPATFRQFLLICDQLQIDKDFEQYLIENHLETEQK